MELCARVSNGTCRVYCVVPYVGCGVRAKDMACVQLANAGRCTPSLLPIPVPVVRRWTAAWMTPGCCCKYIVEV